MTMPALLSRARGACQRRAASWFGRRPFTLPPGRPIISFTFDDFPRSALASGGTILEQFNAAGTYYVSLGLSGQTTVCGEMFDRGELPRLLERGHELGCHTFGHCPAWETSPDRFEAEVIHNAAALQQCVPGASFRTLSYPITQPRPGTKHRVSRYFHCCRGGGQTYNAGTIDLNYVAAFFLEQSVERPEVIRQVVAENQAAGGWLIFATHDVSRNPSRFGCTPDFFGDVVRLAVNSGAEVLPMAKAWVRIQQRARLYQ